VIKFTYWWCQELDQWQIKQQLGLGSQTAVDWNILCRELCEVTLFEEREKLGGPGKVVEIDESKIGQRKYYRGHVVKDYHSDDPKTWIKRIMTNIIILIDVFSYD